MTAASAYHPQRSPYSGKYGRTPLVSCIMPTADRPGFVALAIRRFLAQSYPNAELIILDDGHAPVEAVVPDHARIYYHRQPGGISLGEKRNHCVERARGNIILHWDDDDWTAPDWIGTQVRHLQQHEADVTGLSQLIFVDPLHGKAWDFHPPDQDRPWLHGGTLCYRRALWQRNPFPPVDVGEDCQFLWSAADKSIVPHPGKHLFAATVHRHNTSPKLTRDQHWLPLTFDQMAVDMDPELLEMRTILQKQARH